MGNAEYEEGLVGSLLLYMAALLGVLALAVVPVYLANRGTVQPNTGFTSIPYKEGRFPLAYLQSPALVDPALVAKLNAGLEKSSRSYKRTELPATRPAESASAGTAYAERETGATGGPSSPNYQVLH